MGWLILIFVLFTVVRLLTASNKNQELQKAHAEMLRRRKDAEDYIMDRDDPQAIETIMLARENPAKYNQVLEKGISQGNDTLETALGIVTGYLIYKAITEPSVSSASEDMQEKNEVEVDACENEYRWEEDMSDDDFDDFYFG